MSKSKNRKWSSKHRHKEVTLERKRMVRHLKSIGIKSVIDEKTKRSKPIACVKNGVLRKLYNENLSATPKFTQSDKGPGYVYFIGNLTHQYVKIGYSLNPKKRLTGIQTGCPFPVTILATMPGSKRIETHLHDKFRKWRTVGEWFYITRPIADYMLQHTKSVFDQGTSLLELSFTHQDYESKLS